MPSFSDDALTVSCLVEILGAIKADRRDQPGRDEIGSLARS
jgi:hypothetical protein